MKFYKTRVRMDGVTSTGEFYKRIRDIVAVTKVVAYDFPSLDEVYVFHAHPSRDTESEYKSTLEEPSVIVPMTPEEVIEFYQIQFSETSKLVNSSPTVYVIQSIDDPLWKEIHQASHKKSYVTTHPNEPIEVLYDDKLVVLDIDPSKYFLNAIGNDDDTYSIKVSLRTTSREELTDEQRAEVSEWIDNNTLDSLLDIHTLIVDERIDYNVKAYRTTINMHEFNKFAKEHEILDWDSVALTTVRITYREGVTSPSVVRKFEDEIIAAGIPLVYDMFDKNAEDNRQLLSSIQDVLSKDFTAAFVESVSAFSDKSNDYHSELRQDLLDIEEEYNKYYSDEVTLFIDWETLTAEAYKKERITYIPCNKVSQQDDNGFVYVSMEAGDSVCWIHEDQVEQYLETHVIDEHIRKVLPELVEYPFIITEVNRQLMLIEVLIK